MIYVKCTLGVYILAIHWDIYMLVIEVHQPTAIVKLTSSISAALNITWGLGHHLGSCPKPLITISAANVAASQFDNSCGGIDLM